MNDAEIHQYLKNIDQKYLPEDEHPEGFDYLGELQKIKNIRMELELSTKLVFRIDDQIQDAFFFAELIHDDVTIESKAHFTGGKNRSKLIIRFSYFGKLATYCIEHTEPQIEKSLSMSIRKILERNNYICANPGWLTSTPYDGIHPYFSMRKDSWWYRFFDYK